MWFVFGLASIGVDWKCFVTWVVGTYMWEAFAIHDLNEEVKK
jgi:hypothetical protein